MSPTRAPALAGAIDAILPQTQCTQCGYPSCEPYARAVAAGEADINRCVPGGEEGVHALARLTGRAVKPVDPRCGRPGPLRVAVIDEAHCIGCTLCIQACPVDAIAGAAKLMHTVIQPLCTGCALCVPPCPVDCIEITTPSAAWARWTPDRAAAARHRFEARRERLARGTPAAGDAPAQGSATAPGPLPTHAAPAAAQAAEAVVMSCGEPPRGGIQAVIQAAVARVRARREAAGRG